MLSNLMKTIFVRLLPSNMTPINLSGLSNNFIAASAPLFFSLAWCLILYLFMDIKAVSEPEKNADKRKRINKTMNKDSIDKFDIISNYFFHICVF